MNRRAILGLLAVCLTLSGWPSPAAAQTAATPVPTDASTVHIYLERLADIGFRGAVLVAQDGESLLSEGYGSLEPDGSEQITAETVFAIGSNTKPFTAAAILKLQDQGTLQVTDRIDQFLPNVPPDKRAITIHQLLTHSAGFNHSGIFEGDSQAIVRDAAVQRILASELLFPPGSESSYADASMILLAAIIEIASGQQYETYLRNELFVPAGMTHSGFHGEDASALGSPLAVGVVEGKAAGSASTLPHPDWALKGAGGMVSTVNDLYRFHAAVQTGKILSPQGQEEYAAPHVPLDNIAAEGYGSVVAEPEAGHRVRASAGGTDEIGHVNVIAWWMDDDLVVIVSSANAAYTAEDVATGIARLMLGLPQALPPAMVAVDPSTLASLAGRFELPDGGAIIVHAADDRLLFSPEGEAAYAALYPPDEESAGQSDPEATIAYLESGQEPGLEEWQAEQAATLGPFQGMSVVGNASAEGSSEVWTYVAFEFAKGSVLSRWIVNADGILGAAAIPSDPPTLMFLPTAPQTFTSFAMGNPEAFTAAFTRDGAGTSTLVLTSPSDVQATATMRVP